MKNLIDKKLAKFLLVGVVNTLVGTAIMFGLYNLAHCSYWVSSAANYILTSILSFFLNKYFTFQNKENSVSQVLRFAANIAVCYLLAYGIAKPLCLQLLASASTAVRDNVSMFVGMCLFTGFNYLGQRFFAFKEK
ncbi:GtrA family protein [Agathobaculum sp.]|uniref:GtrA family protein n=1 Tax=Agathobaculum sp. TaxID=2048138 RepID=UPI002A7F581F|nr:GtrA family protein [Agathobaculum sp.]MDY3617399.1 GtrA family protein [Agathobaculum sp.]